MLDTEKLEKQTNTVAAYAALRQIYKKSFEPAVTAEELHDKLQSTLLMAGYALGRLSKELREQGYSQEAIDHIMAKVNE